MEIQAVNIRAKRVLPFHSDAAIFSRIAACQPVATLRRRPDRSPRYINIIPFSLGKRDLSSLSFSDSKAPSVPSLLNVEWQSDEATQT